MNQNKLIKIWYIIQTSISIIILLIASIGNQIVIKSVSKRQISLTVCLILLLLALLQFTVLFNNKSANWITQLNYVLQSYTTVYILSIIMMITVSYFKTIHFINIDSVITGLYIYSFFMYIPITKLAICKISNNLLRILTLILLFQQIIWAPTSFSFLANSYLKILGTTGIIGSVSFIIITLIAVYNWGLDPVKVKETISFKNLGLIFIFIICSCTFNAFNTSTSWINFFSSWSFNINYIDYKLVLSGIRAGIVEEVLMRYGILNILLLIFKKNSLKILWSILYDGLIFGFLHLSNLSNQPFSATIQQVLITICSGFFFAALYLYSGTIFLPVFYHLFFDISSFVASGSTLMTSPSIYDWQLSTIFMIIYILLTVFLISGKRLKTIKLNLNDFN